MIGLSRGRPDDRLVRAMSARLRRDVERALDAGDLIGVKVLAATRLELIDQFKGQFEWPEEERTFLHLTLDHVTAEIERRLALGLPQK